MTIFNDLYARKELTPSKIPLYFDVELTNKCNLACKMCGTNYSERTKGYMQNDTFEVLKHYVKKYKIPVRIIGWGEPTLHPQYKRMIQELSDLVPVHVNSNGYRLLQEGPVSIKYSFHGQKDMKINDTAEITGTTTDLEHTKDMPKAVKINKTDTRFIDGKIRSNVRFERCGEVYDKLTILWNGDITVCCGDVEGKYVIGNIKKYTLMQLWTSDKLLTTMRKELAIKNWNCTELCKMCYNYT